MLESELECCRELVRLVDRERVAASGQDLGALLSTNKEREATQAQWARTADRRRAWLRHAGTTVEELCQLDGGLGRRREELAKLTQELQRAQVVNRGLISAVLGQVSDLIDAFRRELPTSRYGSDAALTSPVPRRGGVVCSA